MVKIQNDQQLVEKSRSIIIFIFIPRIPVESFFLVIWLIFFSEIHIKKNRNIIMSVLYNKYIFI